MPYFNKEESANVGRCCTRGESIARNQGSMQAQESTLTLTKKNLLMSAGRGQSEESIVRR